MPNLISYDIVKLIKFNIIIQAYKRRGQNEQTKKVYFK